MIKIEQTSADELVVVQSTPWVRVLGLVLVAAGLGFAVVPNATKAITCESRACVLEERNLVGMRTTHVILAADVQRIDVSGDADTYCVVIATASRSYEVDRCSAKRETRLDELAGELRGFYAGERDVVHRASSDKGIVAFPVILLGLLGATFFLLPRASRARFDRKRGVLLLAGAARIPLGDIEAVALETVDRGDDGPQQHLVLRLKDRGSVPIGIPTSADLAPAKRAIEAFLASADRGYR